MPYSNEYIYIAEDRETIINKYLENYNNLLTTYGIESISLDKFMTNNVRIINENAIQINQQIQEEMGALYSNILNLLIKNSDNYLIFSGSTTVRGIKQILNNEPEVNEVSVESPNDINTTLNAGELKICIDGSIDNDRFSELCYKSIVNSSDKTLGDVETTYSDDLGNVYKYYYTVAKTIDLKVKLVCTTSNNNYDRLSVDEIKKTYMDHFNSINNLYIDLEPSVYNDISCYNGYSTITSAWSFDGTTYEPVNTIKPKIFDKKYIISSVDNIEVLIQ